MKVLGWTLVLLCQWILRKVRLAKHNLTLPGLPPVRIRGDCACGPLSEPTPKTLHNPVKHPCDVDNYYIVWVLAVPLEVATSPGLWWYREYLYTAWAHLWRTTHELNNGWNFSLSHQVRRSVQRRIFAWIKQKKLQLDIYFSCWGYYSSLCFYLLM